MPTAAVDIPSAVDCIDDAKSLAYVEEVTASSRHTGIVNVNFADGHVSSIADTIDRLVWRQIGSRDDGGPTDASY